MGIASKIRTAWTMARNGGRGWPSLVWNTAMARARLPGPLLPPVHIAIEPTNACNLRCPVCETGNGQMSRKRGMLDPSDFRRFIDRLGPYTNTLLFYFMGEPFLNKNAYDMIRYARSKGTFVDTCTNGDFVDAQAVVESGLNRISFQIGGLEQETHEKYRVNGNLERVKANLEQLIEARRNRPGSDLIIDVGLVVMRHNEHEVERFLSWARQMGVDTANVIDPCVRNAEEAAIYLPTNKRYWFYDEAALAQGTLRPKIVPNNQCEWIWNSIQINWNGDAVPCCRDVNGENILGNVFEDGLWRVFNGKRARAFRRRIIHEQNKVGICRLCSGYGLPTMMTSGGNEFAVRRHSVNQDESTGPHA